MGMEPDRPREAAVSAKVRRDECLGCDGIPAKLRADRGALEWRLLRIRDARIPSWKARVSHESSKMEKSEAVCRAMTCAAAAAVGGCAYHRACARVRSIVMVASGATSRRARDVQNPGGLRWRKRLPTHSTAADSGVQSVGEWRCTRMGERMCTSRNLFPSPPRMLLLCLCHLLRRLLYLLHSPLFLQRCETDETTTSSACEAVVRGATLAWYIRKAAHTKA